MAQLSYRGEADGSSWEATTDVDARAPGTWVALDEMIRRRSPEISLSTLEAILDLETIEVAPARRTASTSARRRR